MMRFAFITFALILSVGATPAWAAPQILGLVATNESMPVQCEDGKCSALLSAFCLQQERLPPDFNTAYAPAPGTAVRLVATLRDGRTVPLDANSLARFESVNGFTAVRMSIPATALPADTASLAVAVAPRSAVIPLARAGDPDPLTEAEIAIATGPLRIAAETMFESGSEAARTAVLTARLINHLPPTGDIVASARAGLWAQVAGSDAPDRALKSFVSCGRIVDQSQGYSLRQCLMQRHERLQVETTRAYWDSLGGS